MNLKEFDDSFRVNGKEFIAGFDEAGRGPLCGPVVCAGVVLDSSFYDERINDSKQLTERTRDCLFDIIKEKAVCYEIVFISNKVIDEINILEASRKGMQTALDKFIVNKQKIDVVLTDYMNLKTDIPLKSLAKGDATSLSIACASILAKVARDRYMEELDKIYPQYELAKNKGYPTKRHLELLEQYGPVEEIYRLSYGPVKALRQIKLF